MIRHALTLEHCARELNSLVAGAVLVDAWSQEKLTCVLNFLTINETEVTLKCSVDPTYGSVIPVSNVRRARKNSIDVFPDLIGSTCAAVLKADGDRVISFLFRDSRLHVLLYSGNRGNVVEEREGRILDSLHDKKRLVGDTFEISDHPLTLGKHLQQLGGTDEEIITSVRSSRRFYLLTRDDESVFSPVALPGWHVELESADVFEALRKSISHKRHSSLLANSRKDAIKRLEATVKKHRRALENMRKDTSSQERIDQLRMFGDVLMSDAQPTLDGRTALETVDHSGAPITIKLDKKLTTIENAQEYYNKARRSERSTEERLKRIPEVEKLLEQAERELEVARTSTDTKTLQSMAQSNKQQNDPSLSETQFREFHLNDGYVVFVGKNAANNDQLTMKFAKQNDVWLHARGSSGSHCVLRSPNPKNPIPKPILQQAAEIAAYYSGSRNASWTPVVYTQRKYVRKPKGANVGAVTLSREDVIMVQPKLPEAD